MIKAVAYMRTSSATNVGADKDSEQRQRAAIEGFARGAGYVIGPDDWFYDASVRGADPVTERPGFAAMLARIAETDSRVVICESPDRFARDLIVQLTGHDHLKGAGITLIPASAPDFFTEDTPTAVLVRQVLGAIAQFEKANLVAKLKAARDRKRAATGKCEGRKSHADLNPEIVHLAHSLRDDKRTLRAIAAVLAERGHKTASGGPLSPATVQDLLNRSI